MGEVVTELMELNLLGVFNERDPQRRLAMAQRIYADDVRWTDDEGVTVGREVLVGKAEALQDGPLAGLSFAKDGPVHQTRGLAYLAWAVRSGAGGDPLVTGFDVAWIDDDRITALWTVITSGPDVEH